MKQYIVVVNGKEYLFTSKRESNKLFVDAFLSGKSVFCYEK